MLESNTSGGMAERPSQSQEPPYSIFSKTQKRYIVVIVALAGLFSPLSSFIYYPATKALADSLHTSIEAINLSITSYMIVSGVFPSILGDAADQIGRRPVYIFAFVVYIAANAGLALQDSYSALLILRMVQSVGSSGKFARSTPYAKLGDPHCYYASATSTYHPSKKSPREGLVGLTSTDDT